MKKMNLLRKVLLLCALIVGSTSAWADDTYEYYYNGSSVVNTGNYFSGNDMTSTYNDGQSDQSVTFSNDAGTEITSNKFAKLESSKYVSFTTTRTATITVIAITKNSTSKNGVKLDGTTLGENAPTTTYTSYTNVFENVAAGSHSIQRNGTENAVVYLKVVEHGAADTRTSLTGAWSNDAPSFEKGAASVTIPTFRVTGGESELGTDYSVAYELTTDGRNVTVNSTGITNIDTSVAGTSVVTATVTVINTTNYKMTTTTYTCTITVSATVLEVTADNTTVAFSKENIEANAYLDSNVLSNGYWGDRKFSNYDWITGNCMDWKKGRTVTIKVKGAKSFEVISKNSNDGRPYTVKVGGNAVATLMHQAKTDDTTSDERSSGLIACPSDETTITVEGGSSNSIYLGGIIFHTTDVQATISAAGYASFSNAGAVTIPSGVEAYYMSAAVGESATLTKITDGVIPANTGVVLKGDAGTYSFVGTETNTTYTNKLVANLTTLGTYSYETAGYYTLAAGPTFMLSTGYTSGEASTFLAGGKAFLPKANIDEEGDARALTITFSDDSETTGINAVNSEEVKVKSYYNLRGQRVAQPVKGLYIVNGKKVVVK